MRVWISRDKTGFSTTDDIVCIWAEDKKPNRYTPNRGSNCGTIVFHLGEKSKYSPITMHFITFQNLFSYAINNGTCELYELTANLEKVK